MEFNNLNQLKSFIKSEAKRLGISPTAAYNTYYSRVLLEKLASNNFETLVVKGSFSQYVHLKYLTRPVLDVDITSTLNKNVSSNILLESLFKLNLPTMVLEQSRPIYKTPNGVYKIPIVVIIQYPNDFKKMMIPINIDFKAENKVIFETQYKKVATLFKGDKEFFISTPSFEEHLAEKLFIILHNNRQDILNTRVKDFYDVFMLHGREYDSDKLTLYFETMLLMYQENLENLSAQFLNQDFINAHHKLWLRISKKYEFLDQTLNFSEVVYYVRAVLNEQIQKIKEGSFDAQAKNLARIKKL